MIDFVDRGDDVRPDDTLTADVTAFKRQMAALDIKRRPPVAVVDFANYRMTGIDNGRAVFAITLQTNRRLKSEGGVLLVCNHPVQFNPELQGIFCMDKFIEIYCTLREALDAAQCRLRDSRA